MAELIPQSYRLRVAQKLHLQKWMLGGVVTVALCLASVSYALVWERRQTAACNQLAARVQQNSMAIKDAEQLIASRQELANRMQKVESLMEDKLLLALLHNISEGFAGTDCLESVSIDARVLVSHKKNDNQPAKDAAPPEETYMVRINGITSNNATLADLVTRLSHQAAPAMNVVLESSKREQRMEGQVMRFQILCEKPRVENGT